MMLPTAKPRRIFWSIPALLLAMLAASCATVPKEVYLIEPASRLEYNPEIYFRSSGPVLMDLVSSLGKKELGRLAGSLGQYMQSQAGEGKDGGEINLSSLDDILKRSRTVGAGIRGLGSNSLKMEAVLVGDFIPVSLRIGLAFDGSWAGTDDGGYRSTKYPLFIRPPAPGIVLVSSEAKGPKLPASLSSPYPAAFEGIARSELFISVDGQAALRSFPLPADSPAFPLRAIAVAGTYMEAYLTGKGPTSPLAPIYSIEVRILMKDEASARSYRPIVRFLWAAAAARYFGEGSSAGALVPVQEKDCYIVRGIELTSVEFRQLVESALLGG